MTKMNGIIVYQKQYTNNNQLLNEYHFFAPNKTSLGGVLLPSDGQYMEDSKTLNIITKALMARWRQTAR